VGEALDGDDSERDVRPDTPELWRLTHAIPNVRMHVDRLILVS
jgi:hypothetical protein